MIYEYSHYYYIINASIIYYYFIILLFIVILSYYYLLYSIIHYLIVFKALNTVFYAGIPHPLSPIQLTVQSRLSPALLFLPAKKILFKLFSRLRMRNRGGFWFLLSANAGNINETNSGEQM